MLFQEELLVLKSALRHEDMTVGRTVDPGVEHPLAGCSAPLQALNFHGEKLSATHNPHIQLLPPPTSTDFLLSTGSPGAFSSLEHNLRPLTSKMISKGR